MALEGSELLASRLDRINPGWLRNWLDSNTNLDVVGGEKEREKYIRWEFSTYSLVRRKRY
jgi:hypothetical protein